MKYTTVVSQKDNPDICMEFKKDDNNITLTLSEMQKDLHFDVKMLWS